MRQVVVTKAAAKWLKVERISLQRGRTDKLIRKRKGKQT